MSNLRKYVSPQMEIAELQEKSAFMQIPVSNESFNEEETLMWEDSNR